MTLYEVLIELSKTHSKFVGADKKKFGYSDLLKFDLKNKTISNGSYKILNKGVLVRDEILLSNGNKYKIDGLIDEDFTSPYEKIRELYKQYKVSIPSTHTQYGRNNFRAKPSIELSVKELSENMQREEAKYRLEGYILLGSLLNKIPWSEEKHFFWKDEADNQLIIFKEWIVR